MFIGNSCRSPIAEEVFRMKIHEKKINEKLEVDSAGLREWNVGRKPDFRALHVMYQNNINCHKIGRQIKPQDFYDFQWILGMDNDIIKEINGMAPKHTTVIIKLLGDFDYLHGERIIQDPNFEWTGIEGFTKCFNHCLRCAEGFFEVNNF